MIFIILAGNVGYRKRPSTLAVINSEVSASLLIPASCVAATWRFFMKYSFSGAVNCKLSMSISPFIWSMEPPLKFAVTFTENSVSSYFCVRFSSCGRRFLMEAWKSKVGIFSTKLILPFTATEPFSSFSSAFPLNPPCLYSPSSVIFSYL